MTEQIFFPEHEKLQSLGDRKDEIQSFIDWLFDDQDFTLAVWGRPARLDRNELVNEGHLYQPDEGGHPIARSFRGRGFREKLMAAYFDIDLDKISDEKDAMLAEIRRKNDKQ
jgi:hypothetical protein